MKTLVKLCGAILVAFSFIGITAAQDTKADRHAAKAASVKKMIDENNYVFIANYAQPMRGGQRNLTSDYDLRVSKDSIIVFLPYFGRSYMAPSPSEAMDGGIKFTSINFNYTTRQKKNGSWEILIKPKDKNITDWRDVQQLTLDISKAGYASLQVLSSNRDPISFDGYIEQKDKK